MSGTTAFVASQSRERTLNRQATGFIGQPVSAQDNRNRAALVADCVQLSPENVRTIAWLPSTCAYRLVAEGEDLRWWHPLVSGSRETVHQAGVSVRGRVSAFEQDLATPEDYLPHMLDDEP